MAESLSHDPPDTAEVLDGGLLAEIERWRLAHAEAMALVLSHEGHIERLRVEMQEWINKHREHRLTIERLMAELEQARSVLLRLEWMYAPMAAYTYCPICRIEKKRDKPGVHTPDCALTAALGRKWHPVTVGEPTP